MAILLIEYRAEFDGWKSVFDADPMDRAGHGVTDHWIYRDVGDPHHFLLSMRFHTTDEAEAFRALMQPVWVASGAGNAWVLAREAAYR